MDGAGERGEHDILVQDAVRSAVTLDLLGVDRQKRGFTEPAWLDRECPLAYLASARKTLSYSAIIWA